MFTDISTFLGAPPTSWKKEERDQIRAIHIAFRQTIHANNYERFKNQAKRLGLQGDEGGAAAPTKGGDESPEESGAGAAVPNTQNTTETFLVGDSIVLASQRGELREPLSTPWGDFTAFETQMDFAFWSTHFDKPATDLVMNRIASSIVNHICVSQADKTVRSRHGSIPLGRYLRKKREQLTPLGLCMHEMKLWATHVLRTFDAYQKSTSLEINDRVAYIERLQEKEVWGPTKFYPRSGMRAENHHALFRLLLECKADLIHARDYAYRKYQSRAAREKLEQLTNTLKNVVFNEFSMISRLLELNDSLTDATTRALQPTNLFNSARDQSFVNWRNQGTVLLAGFCDHELVRACLLGDLDEVDMEDITQWKENNPYKAGDTYKLEKGCVAAAYGPAAAKVTEKIKANDRSATRPDSVSAVAKALKNAFHSEADAAEVTKAVLDLMDALHTFIPMLYIVFKLHALAGAGGDFTVFDLLRPHVIASMTQAYEYLLKINEAQRDLISLLDRNASAERKRIEQERLKAKKARLMPAWVGNLAHVHHHNVNPTNQAIQNGLEQLLDFKKDAQDYSLNADKLNKSIKEFRKICNELCKGQPGLNVEAPQRFLAVTTE